MFLSYIKNIGYILSTSQVLNSYEYLVAATTFNSKDTELSSQKVLLDSIVLDSIYAN